MDWWPFNLQALVNSDKYHTEMPNYRINFINHSRIAGIVGGEVLSQRRISQAVKVLLTRGGEGSKAEGEDVAGRRVAVERLKEENKNCENFLKDFQNLYKNRSCRNARGVRRVYEVATVQLYSQHCLFRCLYI